MGSFAVAMKNLSTRQLAVAHAVAATIFEADSLHPVPPERLDFTMRELRAYVARAGLQTRAAFRAAFIVVQFAPLFLIGRLHRFTSLSAQAKAVYLRKLEAGPLGLVMVLLKTVLSFVYFEHPDALASTGYDAQGLLGPAWAAGSPSPISKLRVIENPAPAQVAPESEPAPELLPGRVAEGA